MSGQHSRNIRRLKVVEIERLSDAHKKPWAEKYSCLGLRSNAFAPISDFQCYYGATLVLYMLFQGNAGG